MHPKKVAFLLFVLAVGLSGAVSVPLRAQVAGGSLSGTISDPQGAAIVGAKISVKNPATGVTTDTTTNTSGIYNLINLLPAAYDVSVTAQGFRAVVSKVTITVGSQQTMNLALQIGDVSQTVEVTGAAPVIELANATISGNVESQQIVELPLNGRDWAQLATLEPGVVQVRPHEQVTQPGGNLRGLGNQMTIDGNRPQQNVYRLNGIIVNDYSNAGPGDALGYSMGVDAIQEFSVLTANYNAEYGFTSGGVINAITKSGTNTFHGSLFEFFRNEVFDSANYLLFGPDKAPFVRNQFGGSGGWKILKDRWFIFGSYEGLRQSKGIGVTSHVLSNNARQGILTGESPISSCPYSNMTLNPGGTVCVDNTVASYIAALEPAPQDASCVTNICSNHYGGVQGVVDNYFTLRTDYKISENDSVDANYYQDHSTWDKPNAFDNQTSGYVLPNRAASIEENHTFSAAMVNSVRFGYSQSIVTNPGLTYALAAAVDKSFGIISTTNGPGLAGQGGGGAGVTGLTSFGGFNPQGGFSDWVQYYQIFDDLSRTVGNHTLKFGFQFLRNHTDLVNANSNGSVGFGSVDNFLQNLPFTVREPTVPPFTAGNTKHYNRNSVVGGYVQDDWKMRQNLNVNIGLRYEMSTIPYEIDGKFILLNQLWTNPGDCTESITGLPQSDCSSLRHSVFDHNPTLKNFEPRIGFSWDPFKTGKTSVRGGFGIFDVLPMPFMFGLNALQSSPSGAEVDLTNPSQYATTGCTASQVGCAVPQGSFIKGLAALGTGVPPGGTGRWQYTDPNPQRNYVMQWNFNVQRQLSNNDSIMVAYAGSRGIHNPFQTDTLNTCFPTKTSAGWLFPQDASALGSTNCQLQTPGASCPAPSGIVPGQMVNPCVPGLLLSTVDMSQSWYRSLQLNYTRRMSRNLQAEVSFTWQRSMDTSSGSFAGDNFSSNPTAATPWWDLNIVKGLSDFNISKNLSINWLYQIPTPKSFSGPAGWIVRGWSYGGIVNISTGVPMWPLGGLSSDPLFQNNSEPMDVLSFAPGCNAQNAVQPGNLQYLKPNCFTYPVAPSQSFWNANCDQTTITKILGETLAQAGLNPLTCLNLMGNIPRNSIIGPGLVDFDMSLLKDNHIPKLGENTSLQFRVDIFNIFNRPNYSPPTDNIIQMDPVGVANFGVIDQDLQVPMREMQFSLKLTW